MEGFSHLDARGDVRMVDVSGKPPMLREAVATGSIRLAPATIQAIQSHSVAKGNVLATARIAAIQAAKRTGDWIPLCHPLGISGADVDFAVTPEGSCIQITATVRTTGPTGVEMEALTAVSVAALTIYDMCKAVDQGMVMEGIRLVRKTKRPIPA